MPSENGEERERIGKWSERVRKVGFKGRGVRWRVNGSSCTERRCYPTEVL